MKKTIHRICMLMCAALIIGSIHFILAFFGNPISWTIARINTSRYLEENFINTDFQISKVGYNFKTGGYYAFIDSPSSQDSYFTIYFDGWGQYQHDSYYEVSRKYTTYSRLDSKYRELVDQKFNETNTPFDISIVFGELKDANLIEVFSYTDEAGNTIVYTIDKEYGLDCSALVLDKEYDIVQLGRECGSICLYIHDPEVSVNRAAELLLEVKAYLDTIGVPFYAIDFHLCEPRNGEGQLTGEQITLFDFLYSDIYEDSLTDRVQAHWDVSREHHAIQDGIKKELELIDTVLEKIIP